MNRTFLGFGDWGLGSGMTSKIHPPNPIPQTPFIRRAVITSVQAVLVLLLALFMAACGGEGPAGDRREITESQTLNEAPAPPAKALSSAERFGLAPTSRAMSGAHSMASTGVPFAWDKPAAWQDAGATAMRPANFTVAKSPETECYLSVLANTGGGLEANVNRWRKQMSQPEYTAEEFAALPKKAVLGQEAVFVEIDGVFTGTSGDLNKEGYKLLGAVLDYSGSGVFVKMVGPAAVIDKEKANFDAFAASLRPAPAGAHDMETAHASMVPGMPPAGASGAVPGMATGAEGVPLTWQAPAAWQKSPDRPMRVVTYTVGASGKLECVISMLAGAAGGVEANINRWRGQMGLTAATAEDIASLTKITVLGKEAPLVELTGNYTGMDGQEQTGSMFLATSGEIPGHKVFVRMTGPEDEVKAEKENFIAFCQSLKAQ